MTETTDPLRVETEEVITGAAALFELRRIAGNPIPIEDILRTVARAAAEHTEAALRLVQQETRDFPIIRENNAKPHPLRIPWSVAEKAYSVYSSKYGTSQSLERMAERGGFYPSEMDEFHPTWREESDEIAKLRAELATLRSQEIPK